MLLLDVGANAEARAGDLVQFAYLGAAFSRGGARGRAPAGRRCSRSARRPKKGTRAGRRGARRARAAPSAIDFAGNVEGRDLLGDARRRVVTDGFTGNVALKTIEGTASAVAGAVARGRALEPARGASAGCCCARRSAGCAASWTPTPPAARSCSGCAASRSSATAARGRRGSPTPIRLAARAVEQRAVERTGRAARALGRDPRRRLRDRNGGRIR